MGFGLELRQFPTIFEMSLDILLSFCTTNGFKVVSALILKSKYQSINSENFWRCSTSNVSNSQPRLFMKNKQVYASHCIKFILLSSLTNGESIHRARKCLCKLLSLNIYIPVLIPIYQGSSKTISGRRSHDVKAEVLTLSEWMFTLCSHKKQALSSLSSWVLLSTKVLMVQKDKTKQTKYKQISSGGYQMI